MSRNINEHPRRPARELQDPVTEYLSELEVFYPAARGTSHVARRLDNRIIVSVPLPQRASDRMRLFDQMAEVGTRLLLQTGQYIILSAR